MHKISNCSNTNFGDYMEEHKNLKKLIIDNNLISPMDHLIACGSSGWTDLRFTKLANKITNESHYGISLMLKNEPIIFQYDNLKSLTEEITEDFIKNKNCLGYDFKNNRVHVHYEGDNVFRFGNTLGKKIFRKEFQICTLKDLAKRNNYKEFINLLSSKEKHRAIQLLLAELGIKLGYSIKFGRNDHSAILKNSPHISYVGNFLTIENIYLDKILIKNIKDSIDLIDVVWCEPPSNKPIVAFEVELRRNYRNVFTRFSSFFSTKYKPLLIVVGDDYENYRYRLNDPPWPEQFKYATLGYMTLNKLAYILQHIKCYDNIFTKETLYKFIFNEPSILYFNKY